MSESTLAGPHFDFSAERVYTRPSARGSVFDINPPIPTGGIDATLDGATLTLDAELVFSAALARTLTDADAALSGEQVFSGSLTTPLDESTLSAEATLRFGAIFDAALAGDVASFTADRGVSGVLDAAPASQAALAGHHEHDSILRATTPDATATFSGAFILSALVGVPATTLEWARYAPRLISGMYIDIPHTNLTLSLRAFGVSNARLSLPAFSAFDATSSAPAMVRAYRVTSRVWPTHLFTGLANAPSRVIGEIIEPPPRHIDTPLPYRVFTRAPCVIGQRRAPGGEAAEALRCDVSGDAEAAYHQFAEDKRNYIKTAVFPLDLFHPSGFFVTEGSSDKVVTSDTELFWGLFWVTSIIHKATPETDAGDDVREQLNMPADSAGFPTRETVLYGHHERATFTPSFWFNGLTAVGFWNIQIRHDYSINYISEVPAALDADIANGDALFYISATYVVNNSLGYWQRARVTGGLLGDILDTPAWSPEYGLKVWVDCYDDTDEVLGSFALGGLTGDVNYDAGAFRRVWTIYKQFRPYPGTRRIRFKWLSYSQGNHPDVDDRAYTDHTLQGFELFADVHPRQDRLNVIDLANPNFNHQAFLGWDVPRYATHHRVPDTEDRSGLDPWAGQFAARGGTVIQRVPIPPQHYPRLDRCDLLVTFFVQVATLGRYSVHDVLGDPKMVRVISARREEEIDHFVENFVRWDFDGHPDFPHWVEDTAPDNQALLPQVSLVDARIPNRLSWKWREEAAESRWVYMTTERGRAGYPTYPIEVSRAFWISHRLTYFDGGRLTAGETGALVFRIDARIPKRSRWVQIELHTPRFAIVRVTPLYLANIKNIPPVEPSVARPLHFRSIRPLVNNLIIKAELPTIFASFTTFTAEWFARIFGAGDDRFFVVDEAYAKTAILVLDTLGISDALYPELINAVLEYFGVSAVPEVGADVQCFTDERARVVALALCALEVPVVDRLSAGETLHTELVTRILERAGIAATVTAPTSRALAVAERLGTWAGCVVAIRALVEDQLTFTTDVSLLVARVAELSEAVAAGDTGVAASEVYATLIDALLFAEIIQSRYLVDLAESLGAADAVALRATLLARGAEWFEVAAAPVAVFRLSASAGDWVTAADGLAAVLHAAVALTDGFVFVGTLPLDDGDYAMWAFNADTMAASEYTNTAFRNVVTHAGRTYGVLADGVYALTGDTDAGTAIDAMIRTGLTDLGQPGRKGVRKAYLYVRSDHLVYVKAVYDNDGQRSEVWYELTAKPTEPLLERHVEVGRGAKGTQWAFEVTNTDGGELDLRGIDVIPVLLSRRQR